MDGFSLRGYWRTLSERTACKPAMTINRLTTMAMTGRRMNRSVKRMSEPLELSVRRVRIDLCVGREIVLHHHRPAVAQLEGTGAHHRLAGGQGRLHRDQVAAGGGEAGEI